MKNMIYTLRIIRSMEQCVLAVYLQQFFKLCGIYVWEYVVDDNESIYDTETADVNLLLTAWKMQRKMPNAWFDYSADKLTEDSIGQKDGQNITLLAENILEEMFQQVSRKQYKNLYHVFDKLVLIFTKHDYARVDYVKHCFCHQLNEKSIFFAQNYYNCYAELRKQVAEDDGAFPYLRFAMLNCARKINDICRCNGNSLFFRQDVLIKEAAKLGRQYPDFTMGDVLAGTLALGQGDLWRDGVYYLNSVTKKEKGHSYIHFVHYCLGHYYEVEQRSFESAWPHYARILELAPNSYRAMFKEGCRYLRVRDFRSAYVVFETVLSVLEAKRARGWIQPLELEYDYKCHYLNARIKRVYLNDSDGAKVLSEKAKLLSENAFGESCFMTEFFGSHLEECGKYHKKKLISHKFNDIVYP